MGQVNDEDEKSPDRKSPQESHSRKSERPEENCLHLLISYSQHHNEITVTLKQWNQATKALP